MPVFLCKGGVFINKYYKPNPNNSQRPTVNPNDQKRLPEKNNGDLVNESIRFPEVLVIDQNGEKLGVMKRYDAIRAAQDQDLDLLCVNPSGKPPVCKILNYGKYRFEIQKKHREAKKNQTIVLIKEIQLILCI